MVLFSLLFLLDITQLTHLYPQIILLRIYIKHRKTTTTVEGINVFFVRHLRFFFSARQEAEAKKAQAAAAAEREAQKNKDIEVKKKIATARAAASAAKPPPPHEGHQAATPVKKTPRTRGRAAAPAASKAKPAAAGEAGGGGLSKEGLMKLTVKDLRERCKAAGVPTSGRKADIVDRLLDAGLVAS